MKIKRIAMKQFVTTKFENIICVRSFCCYRKKHKAMKDLDVLNQCFTHGFFIKIH